MTAVSALGSRAAALSRFSCAQLLAGKRAIVLGLFAAVTALTIWAIASDSPLAAAVDVREAVRSLLLPLLVPLVSLTFSTAALGDELSDGTAAHIVLKPISRGAIVLVKLASAIAVTLAVLVPTAILGHVLSAGGLGSVRLLAATLLALLLSSVVYCALGLLLSLVTSRALVLGLAYMLLWEGALVGLAPGLAVVSVRGYAESAFDALLGDPHLSLGPTQAVLSALVVSFAAVLLAGRRFQQIDLD